MIKAKIIVFDNMSYTTIDEYIREFDNLTDLSCFCYEKSNYYIKYDYEIIHENKED